MSIENPNSEKEGAGQERRIEESEARLSANLGNLNEIASKELSDDESEHVRTQIEETNHKLKERLQDWPITGGIAYALLNLGGGGVEGMEQAAVHMAEGGVGVAAVAAALWGISRLRMKVGENKEQS